MKLNLISIQGELEIQARLVRSCRVGWRRHECGFAFVNLSDGQRASLMQFVRTSVAVDLPPLVKY